jgi:hypothetical protein
MTCRNAKDDVKTGGSSSFRDQFGGCPEGRPSDIRHGGGAKPDQALVRNVRTCRPAAKGDVQAAKTARTRIPMRGTTGAEQPVVGRKVLSWDWTETPAAAVALPQARPRVVPLGAFAVQGCEFRRCDAVHSPRLQSGSKSNHRQRRRPMIKAYGIALAGLLLAGLGPTFAAPGPQQRQCIVGEQRINGVCQALSEGATTHDD